MLLKRWLKLFALLVLGSALLAYSNYPPGDQLERIHAFSRQREFDFVSWTLNALGVKINQTAVDAVDYLPPEVQQQLVLDYLDLVARYQQVNRDLNDIYADPEVKDPGSASRQVLEQLVELQVEINRLGPLAESILQAQISETVADLGLTVGGQPLPPVLYHSTPLPTALIVSPRDEIKQEHHISLEPNISIDERETIEGKVDAALDVSSLIVDIGGVGVYPTMVSESSDINYLTEVVAHEWVHNFLTLRPLGISYTASPELRTMNETTASIAGEAIGRAVVARYYPQLLPPPPPEDDSEDGEEVPEPVFDFREEMRQTRISVDQLLEEGKIEEAEEYMEARRQFLWENGYHLRKLNQAYFAFHGAYADQPGGPAGDDPVGAAVRALFQQSLSLEDFLKTIAWMTSFEELQEAVGSNAD